MTRPRRFGRARSLPLRKRTAEFLYDLLYRGGWASALAHPLGLQGTLRVATHDVVLRVPAAPHGLPPALRVAFASDLHAGPATHPAILAAACRSLGEASPDLLLLGGDYVSFHARFVDELVPLLTRVQAPLGKFAVLGNHDLIGDQAYITARLADAGVRVLVNQNVRLPAPFDQVWVCGLDDPEQGAPDAEAALAGATGTRLVLMHSPEGLRALEGHRVALALCGHVHGGQCWVGTRSLIGVHGAHNTRCRRGGLFDLDGDGDRLLLVSRGIGQGSLPLRRRADPETHRCTIHWRAADAR